MHVEHEKNSFVVKIMSMNINYKFENMIYCI